jgi:microcystin-dependent protein
MSEPFIGEITLSAGNFAPKGWAFCQGQLLAIQQYSALFSILGTTYGGDGVTTFALPDLRGRAPLGFGQGPGLSSYVLGQASGAQAVTLNVNQLPAHTHALMATAASGSVPSPAGAFNAANVDSQGGTATDFAAATPAPVLAAMAAGSVGNSAGGSGPVAVVQPFLALEFIIALEGTYPSRN